MWKEVESDLRRFEKVSSRLISSELLAWTVETRGHSGRVEIALLCAKTEPSKGLPGWILAQVIRHPGEDIGWTRTLWYRELKMPLSNPRPGEDLDGTWHGFAHYSHAPTGREICEFAAVDFLSQEAHADWRVDLEGVQRRAWLRVVGEEPTCNFLRTAH